MAAVSVVIPTFRRPSELVEAIGSVLAQAETREVIVVDDCPQGSARPAVATINDARVRYLRNQQPSGGHAGRVRNIGWPLTSGEFIHFLDDDDRLPAGGYAAALAAFRSRPEVGVVFGAVEPFGDSPEAVARERAYFAAAARRAARSQRFGRRWVLAARMFFDATMLICGAALIRRQCVPAIGGFNGDLPVMEDVDFYARAIRRFGACFIESTVLHYRIGPSLMHRPEVQPLVRASYQKIHAACRAERGPFDYYAMKLIARAALRVL